MARPVGLHPGGHRGDGLRVAHFGDDWVVPMHYRTPRIGFLETEEEFAAAFPEVVRPESPSFDSDRLERPETGAVAVIPASP